MSGTTGEARGGRHFLQRVEDWLNEDAEMRSIELLVGENLRCAVRLRQIMFVYPGEKVWQGEAGTFPDAFDVAMARLRAEGDGGGH